MPNDWTREREGEAWARCEAATKGPWERDLFYVCAEIEYGRPGGEVIIQCHPTTDHRDRERDERNAEFIAHARTDLSDAIREIGRLRAGEIRAQKVLEEESANARGVFAELQKMTGQRDMAITKHEMAHMLIESLGADVKRLRDELTSAWTHMLQCPCSGRLRKPPAPPEECTCGLKDALWCQEGEPT